MDEAKGSGAGWAWLTTGAMFVGAAALIVLPRTVPSLAPTVAKWAGMGLTWPLLAGLGVVVAAIAKTSRGTTVLAASNPSPVIESDPAESAAQEQMSREIANELARVRGGLHDLRIEFVYVKDALSRLQQGAQQGDSESDHETEAAIFRLAASLDQLGGRIEHELCSQRTWLASAFDELARTKAQDQPIVPAFADPYTQAFEGAPHEVHMADGFVASDDDLHIEVSLDEDIWSTGLGVLDEIEEPPAPFAHAKTSPSSRPISAESLLGEFHQVTGVDPVARKMERLRELLSDPAVQRALESQTL